MSLGRTHWPAQPSCQLMALKLVSNPYIGCEKLLMYLNLHNIELSIIIYITGVHVQYILKYCTLQRPYEPKGLEYLHARMQRRRTYG
jgi:hypothetical protein